MKQEMLLLQEVIMLLLVLDLIQAQAAHQTSLSLDMEQQVRQIIQ